MKLKVHFSIREIPVSIQDDVEVEDMDDNKIKEVINSRLEHAYKVGDFHRLLHVGHIFFIEQLS